MADYLCIITDRLTTIGSIAMLGCSAELEEYEKWLENHIRETLEQDK